jgi:hypothetical protein
MSVSAMTGFWAAAGFVHSREAAAIMLAGMYLMDLEPKSRTRGWRARSAGAMRNPT